MYDVIVVGARCAGAPTAMLFARAGYKVLLLDRATVLGDTLSSLYIHQPGVSLLAEWQVLDAVVATGCPPIDQAIFQMADVRLQGCAESAEGIRTAYAPRRQDLDAVLARAAVAAGAELRMGCMVRGLRYADDRVAGVRYQSASGMVEEHARLVVGADGMRSTVASAVKAQLVVDDPTMTCAYYSYWAGVEAGFEIYAAPGNNVGVIPTSGGLTIIGAYFPQDQFDKIRLDAAATLRESIRRTAPGVYERMLGGEQVERLRGTGCQLNFFREATGPGWVLVGDASHHKDSITARGITDAFIQADLLARNVGADLQDPVKLDAALARYEQERDDALAYSYYSTLSTAELAIPAHKVDMLRMIAADPVLVDRYFGLMAGTCQVEDLSLS